MSNTSPNPPPPQAPPAPAMPLGGAQAPFLAPSPREMRAQAVQRLQVGLFGLALMLLLVGLANIIMEHARLADSAAGNTAHASASAASGNSDPLADIGVIPAPDPAGGSSVGRRPTANHPAH